MRSTLFTFTKHTMGRVRRRTSTKQRSMMLVVRSFLHRCRGKLKNDSNSVARSAQDHRHRTTQLLRIKRRRRAERPSWISLLVDAQCLSHSPIGISASHKRLNRLCKSAEYSQLLWRGTFAR
jgi:hypothetical protein